MAKCRGGVCGLKNKPKKRALGPRFDPTAALAPQVIQPKVGQGVPQQFNPQSSLQQQMSPLGNSSVAQPIAQQLQQGLSSAYGQGNPQMQPSYAQGATADMQQYNPQAGFQGPLQGLAQGQGWYSPYQQPSYAGATAGMQQQQQQYQPSSGIPTPNSQNVGIPQGQVIHPTGKQRGKVGRFFSGTRPQIYNNPLYTQFQNQALNHLTQFGLQGIDYLDQNEPGNEFNFAPIGNQELERFYTQTIPSIAERFTAMGGGQRSSAFQGALGQAGRGLGNDLAAQQQQYNMQQQQMAQNQYGMNQNLYTNLLSLGLRPQFESNLQPGRGGVIPGLIDAGAKIAGTALRGGF